jgi:uncharacterized protein with FMN-binding domain
MKRATAVVASTAAGFAGVLALHTALKATPLALGQPRAASTTTAPPAQPGASSTTVPSTQPGALVSAVGASENYGYGVLSVKVSVRASHIVDVTLANIQAPESYSQQLAQQVIPMLRSEVLSAQSAHVNGISGATYTSEAYLYSLQAALDQLHVK